MKRAAFYIGPRTLGSPRTPCVPGPAGTSGRAVVVPVILYNDAASVRGAKTAIVTSVFAAITTGYATTRVTNQSIAISVILTPYIHHLYARPVDAGFVTATISVRGARIGKVTTSIMTYANAGAVVVRGTSRDVQYFRITVCIDSSPTSRYILAVVAEAVVRRFVVPQAYEYRSVTGCSKLGYLVSDVDLEITVSSAGD